MERIISLSLGEVVLKGKNRKYFVDRIVSQINRKLQSFSSLEITRGMGKIYIKGNPDEYDDMIEHLKFVFGIVYISPGLKTEKNLESIYEAINTLTSEYILDNPTINTFKCESTRGDKKFEFTSQEISAHCGANVLRNFPKLKVDVHNPDFRIYTEIKDKAYVYIKRHRAYGGLPLGTNGKGLLLLSGGIDSPVAGFLMAKRGVTVHALHFYSYPFTSERAENKVIELAKELTHYTDEMTLYSVNLLSIQKEINMKCPENEMTILSRRFMMRIAERIAADNDYISLITGENLGQVASQTIHGINVVDKSTDMLILRPLIGMDKVDIIDWSKKIGTYETSIEPFEDCCSVFLPKHPILKPQLEDIEASESVLNVEELVASVIEDMKIIKLKDGVIV